MAKRKTKRRSHRTAGEPSKRQQMIDYYKKHPHAEVNDVAEKFDGAQTESYKTRKLAWVEMGMGRPPSKRAGPVPRQSAREVIRRTSIPTIDDTDIESESNETSFADSLDRLKACKIFVTSCLETNGVNTTTKDESFQLAIETIEGLRDLETVE